ncbi:capsule biosynthesis GfcC family protein [Aliivibrio sp. EL58]|uniref:capsule biosynthesis GfcC family protein n=1 Tax=Aliivibrio sp. EL58 TaxID=2107582 RepID=UPI000EFD031B|nr:capsule biosynthesis GfcC family protein [Aliivibrio sp. EL58]
MLRFFFCFLFISTSTIANTAETNTLTVTLDKQSLQLSYPQPARMATVLNDYYANTDGDFYLLGAVLSNDDKQHEIDDLKTQIINQLKQVENSEALVSQLNTFSYVARVFTSLDRDLVRIDDGSNPLFSGHYTLSTSTMPNAITVIGAIESNSPIVLPLIEHASVDNYLEQVKLSTNADNTQIAVIQPDAFVQMTEFTLWKNNPVYLAPGAVVYVPFSSLPSESSSLNESIIQLLRNKAL